MELGSETHSPLLSCTIWTHKRAVRVSPVILEVWKKPAKLLTPHREHTYTHTSLDPLWYSSYFLLTVSHILPSSPCVFNLLPLFSLLLSHESHLPLWLTSESRCSAHWGRARRGHLLPYWKLPYMLWGQPHWMWLCSECNHMCRLREQEDITSCGEGKESRDYTYGHCLILHLIKFWL